MKYFLVECSGDIWIDVAKSLQQQFGAYPQYWTADLDTIKQAKELFTDTICHHNIDAVKAINNCLPKDFLDASLDHETLFKLSSYESIAIQMMERMDATGKDFTYSERKRHYHKIVRHCLTVLNNFKPDVVIFSIAPHLIYDYVLYAVCQHLNIPCLMLERLGCPGWYFITDTIGGKPLVKHNNISIEQQAQKALLNYYEATRKGGDPSIPLNFQKKITEHSMHKNRFMQNFKNIETSLLKLAYLLKKNGLKPLKRSYRKIAGKTISNSEISSFSNFIYQTKAILYKRKLFSYMHKKASGFVVDVNYIFVALHYQPERATVPMAGFMSDQLLIIDLLAKSLPNDWVIYVKEHPWQLHAHSKGECARDKEFYDVIAQHRCVKIIDMSVDTSWLIANARAVVTSTGSVGWQAVCRRINSLIFGKPWYQGCNGCFSIINKEQLINALSIIENNEKPNEQKIISFLSDMTKYIVPVILAPNLECTPKTHTNDIKLLSVMINKFYQDYVK